MVKIIEQSENYNIVEVTVKKTPYNIYIGDVLPFLTKFVAESKHRSVKVIGDGNIREVGHLDTVVDTLRQTGKKISQGILRSGEQYKHIKYAPDMCKVIDDPEFDRKGLVIALGGGVVGDSVGWMASDYLRGIDLVQMPTTPLSGADSSIGGKIGIDTDEGKNRWGGFKQPIAVFQVTAFFKTLNTPELRHYGYDSGWSESLKHGGISYGLHEELDTQEKYIDFLDKNLQGIKNMDEKVIRHCMLRNALVKGGIVEIDEKEQGVRVCLNFGHSFGHALETYMNALYLKKDPSRATVFPHGDAVGIGVHFASLLSIIKGTGLTEDELKRQVDMYDSLGIQIRLPKEVSDAFEPIYKNMRADKKAIMGTPQFVLQERLGQLQQTSETQPDGSAAPGGYYLQPVDRKILEEAFHGIQ